MISSLGRVFQHLEHSTDPFVNVHFSGAYSMKLQQLIEKQIIFFLFCVKILQSN